MGAELEADAGGFERSPADLELKRVVAEESEMTGAGTGRDPRQHRHARYARADRRQPIKVGGGGRLELRLATRLHGQAAEAVGHEEDDLGRVLFDELTDEVVFGHGVGSFATVVCYIRRPEYRSRRLGDRRGPREDLI